MDMDSATKVDKRPVITERERSGSNSSNSSRLSLKPPRTPRFAEATTVNSPIEPTAPSRASFVPTTTTTATTTTTTTHHRTQPQPSDIGFGYVTNYKRDSRHDSSLNRNVEMPITPKSPLKSALKSPGAAAAAQRNMSAMLSPTFGEEQELEKQEKLTEKDQAKDLVSGS